MVLAIAAFAVAAFGDAHQGGVDVADFWTWRSMEASSMSPAGRPVLPRPCRALGRPDRVLFIAGAQ